MDRKIQNSHFLPIMKDYYQIINQKNEENSYLFHIQLNPDCCVYKGHFPNEPISPGVCNVEMIKECAEIIANKPLNLFNIQRCRFLRQVIPQKNKYLAINLHLEQIEHIYKLTASITDNKDSEVVYMELKGELSEKL